jgi:tyrosyl-tRNA synthetase
MMTCGWLDCFYKKRRYNIGMTKTDEKQIDELLTRGVEEVIDKENLKKKLLSGKKLRIKLGIDPTSPNIHIGRSIPLLKLRDFQQLGHKIVLIIGDFTGLIGDTSDKESERPMLAEEIIKQNLKNYTDQAGKLIDMEKCEVRYNSEWLGKLDYFEIGKQADVFSLHDFVSRENIKKRLDDNKRISLRELLYPLMQGFDSVAIEADVELGGTDQRFNLLAGRELQRYYKQEPQDIIMNPLIEGLDGRKMSSSWGNTVNLFDEPNDMFGKIMSLKDEFIIKYFVLTTRENIQTIKQYENDLISGENPKNIKTKLAFELTKIYHGEEVAKNAEEYFVKTFSKGEIPIDILELKPEQYNIVSILIKASFVSSKSEARRVIEQGGVKVNNIVITDTNFVVEPNSTIQKGKMSFVKII